MAAIRTIDKIAAKWASVTPLRTEDFREGVSNPRVDWARATGAASDSWKAGVTAAIQANSFAKGVARAGTPAWQEATLLKGVNRWGPGVQLGQDKYARGFAPFRDAIERCNLPPRGPRRDPRNLERVKAIVDCLVKAKAAQGS